MQLLASIRNALDSLPGRGDPIHSKTATSLSISGIGGWVGGYIFGSSGEPAGAVLGFGLTAIASYAAVLYVPHPEVILDAWRRQKGEFEGGDGGAD
jgi:hypothetical protein